MVEQSPLPATAEIELADVVRRFGADYTAKYGHWMMPSQKRALEDIAACCTRELGGRLYRCDDCQESFWRFYCCRNRACPKCHGSQTQQWLQQRQAEILPCDYFHVVATIPAELRELFRRDQKSMYGLLMQVSAEAVKELCAEKRHLGALPAILSVLHTWNGQLGYHPHVHMLISGGGVTPNGRDWQPTRGEFLLPVRALSRRIAHKFRDALKERVPTVFQDIPPTVWCQEWVSFCKHYGRSNDAVLNYLSRYVFRTAICNARILDMDRTHVTFRWKNSDTGQWHSVRLPGVEFLRRFLQHVLPRGFHKVRYYGLWHPSQRHRRNQAWLLLMLEKPADKAQPPSLAELLEQLEQGADLSQQHAHDGVDDEPDSPRCPHCGGLRTWLLGEWTPFSGP